MVIPVINYQSLVPQGNPTAKGMLPAIMQGLQLGSAPSQMMQELKKSKLANALKELQLKYAPQMSEAEIGYKQAQIPHLNAQTRQIGLQSDYYPQLLQQELEKRKFDLRNPLLNQTGTAGQIGALMYLKEHPELSNLESPPMTGAPVPQNELAKLLSDSLKAQIEQKNAYSDFYTQRAEGYKYQTLPASQKQYMIAQAAGMGIDPNIATKKFIQGASLAQLAQEQGIDPNNLPNPIYPATSTDISRIHQREQALAEINKLEPILADALSPYSQRVAGYSPKQIGEALTGTNPDSQSKFLAAQALMPELASIRLKAMGGQVGIEALREVTNASMGHIKSYQSLVKPEIYRQAQRYVDQWINEAVSAANRVGLQPGSVNKNPLTLGQEDINNLKNSGIGHVPELEGMVVVQSPSGKKFQIPSGNLEKLLSDHPEFKKVR